jgi:non-ribosomal peptide synthase protein (TIGR01720 family)
LVIDGVSWRILLDDLERSYAALAAESEGGAAVAARRPSNSYGAWARRLASEAATDETLAELPYWLGQQPGLGERLPRDHDLGPNTVGSSATVLVEFDEGQTSALLREAPRRLRAQAEEVLLFGVAEALCRWTGRGESVVAREGHGREPVGGLEPSRTVGWFTSLYPIRLRRAGGGVVERLASVRDQIRAVPRKGLGYGLLRYVRGEAALAGGAWPEVSFNYLGQWDANLGGLFRGAAEDAGQSQWAGEGRASVLEVHGSVSEGRLRMEWEYSRNLHSRETVVALAQVFRDAVAEVIHACEAGHVAHAPADVADHSLGDDEVADLSLSDEELDDLIAEVRVHE